MRSIVILGAGDLGGALARQIAAWRVAPRIVLVDQAATVAQGKALDINQAAPVDGYPPVVAGSPDESAATTADALVIADRVVGGEWEGDAGLALVRRVTHLNAHAPVICAGASQLALVERGVREMGLASRRLIGSAPEGLRSAIVSMTALEARCSPADVCLTVVGRPPRQTIVPWEDASIGGRRAADVLAAPAIARLDARLERLWPPGPLTLAGAAARVLGAAVARRPDALSLFVSLPRDGADPERTGVLPVSVTAAGLARVLSPRLSARDRVRLETALQG